MSYWTHHLVSDKTNQEGESLLLMLQIEGVITQKEDSFQQAGQTSLAVGIESPSLNPENSIPHVRMVFSNSTLCTAAQAKRQL